MTTDFYTRSPDIQKSQLLVYKKTTSLAFITCITMLSHDIQHEKPFTASIVYLYG